MQSTSDNRLRVAYPVGFLNTSEANMKWLALQPPGLVSSLGGFFSPSKRSAGDSNDSFLVADKWEKMGDEGLMDSRSYSRRMTENADHWSVESSGNPANSPGLPAPGAGWISVSAF
jgi:hypothetical protein